MKCSEFFQREELVVLQDLIPVLVQGGERPLPDQPPDDLVVALPLIPHLPQKVQRLLRDYDLCRRSHRRE